MKEQITRISEFRKGKFTQKEMADMLNLSERQYRRIEKTIANLTFGRLSKLQTRWVSETYAKYGAQSVLIVF